MSWLQWVSEWSSPCKREPRGRGRPIRAGSCTILSTSIRLGLPDTVADASVKRAHHRPPGRDSRRHRGPCRTGRTSIAGLLLSKVETETPDHSLTDPLLVVMAQG